MIAVDKAFHHEAVTWSQIKHPNIVPFYGISNDVLQDQERESLCILSPWMSNGNIMVYLKGFPRTNHYQLVDLIRYSGRGITKVN